MFFKRLRDLDWGAVLRRAVLAWLAVALVVYNLLPDEQKLLYIRPDVGAFHPALIAALFAVLFSVLCLAGRTWHTAALERWGIFALCLILAGESVLYRQDPLYLVLLGCILVLSLVYAVGGRSGGEAPAEARGGSSLPWLLLTAFGAGLVFVFLAVWGLSRVRGYSASTFDFGLFAQMFHKMSVTGRQLTTLERDGLLSHFAVHVSPIWYLLLPFWLIWPKPEILPILQAAVLVSAVIPLWLLAKRLDLPPLLRCLACAVLLAHPAFSGGIGYDIHENCFLTPLLLWLFWAVEAKRPGLTALFAVLTCAVKEDAPVYTAVFGVYLLVRGLLGREDRDRNTGLCLLGGAVVWFLGAVAVLRNWGEGTMDWRYRELMDLQNPSLLSVVQTVLLAPLRAVIVAAKPEKLLYAVRFLAPLLALPLLTRKQERYLLLIPFLLYHLLCSNSYQYNLLFQYGFGTLAFLLYLSLLNLRDLLPRLRGRTAVRAGALLAAAMLGLLIFSKQVLPQAKTYVKRWVDSREDWARVGEVLETVPRDATVTCCTYYAQGLCDREVVYDLYYTTAEHLLESEYVVLQPMYELDFKHWNSSPEAADGRQIVYALLEENGYRLIAKEGGWIEIYRKE